MKKRSAATLNSSPPKKTTATRSPLSRRSTAPAPSSEEFSTRLEVITILPARNAEPPPFAPSVELQRVRFGYFQPGAREIFLVGSFNDWNPRATPWRDDPSAHQTASNSFGGFDAVIVG